MFNLLGGEGDFYVAHTSGSGLYVELQRHKTVGAWYHRHSGFDDNIAENAEEIKTLLVTANGLMEDSETAILGQLNELAATLSRLRHLLPDTTNLQERVDTLRIELKDIAYDLHRHEDSTQFDEDQLQSLQERYQSLSIRLFILHQKQEEVSLSLTSKGRSNSILLNI